MSTQLILPLFDQLVEQLQQLNKLIMQEQPSCWVALTDDEHSNRITHLQKCIAYYQDIWYQGNQDGRETRSCYGLIAANETIIELAKKVNNIKDELRFVIQQVQKNDKDEWLSSKALLNKRHENLQEHLYYSGLSRIHLKQIYRHIPILDDRPDTIRFSWYTSGRSIKKITREEAEKKLIALGEEKEHIQVQLNKLKDLAHNEILAQIQKQAPVVRANLVFKKLDNEKNISETIRKAMNVSLPILIPQSSNQPLPQFNEISLTPPPERTRQQRSDFKISDEVFLPSIRAHRYL